MKVTENKIDFSIRPKIKVDSRKIENKSKDFANIDSIKTIFTAQADTVITITDSTGNLRGVFELNTSFVSDKVLSENSVFDFKYLIKSIGYDTERNQTIKEKTKETNSGLLDRLGIGLFMGGIYTKEKSISYGLGVGIIYKLTN